MAIAENVLKNQDKDGMLRRALERIIQLYTDKSHFIYELLQNAEDAGATKIHFLQYQDRLEVLHNGHPFTAQNLQGLCDIGKSDKIGDLNQIGEFGVGFKSVFGICEIVKLYSHPTPEQLEEGYVRFAVEIRDFTHPSDIDDEEIPDGFTTKFVFPYAVGYTFSGFQTIEALNNGISLRLQNLGITTLLFMKHLQSIEYTIHKKYSQDGGVYELKKNRINDHCVLVSAEGENHTMTVLGKETSSYLVFSRAVEGIETTTTLDLAFPVMVDENGHYTYLPAKSPYISVYFPTETESKLGFIVQGPYRTTPNRSSVPQDDKDNIALAHQTAELLVDTLCELRDKGEVNYSLFNILPINKNEFENTPLFLCLYEATLALMQKEKMLLCADKVNYTSVDCAVLARNKDLPDIVTDTLLTDLYADDKEYHWLPTDLTETNSRFAKTYSYLVHDLKISVIRPEDLGAYFTKNKEFLKARSDDWLEKLYNLYNTIPNVFARGGSMRTSEFIRNTKGEFVAPYRKIGAEEKKSSAFQAYFEAHGKTTMVPNIFLPVEDMDRIEDVNFVDPVLLKRCPPFFRETLDLEKPDEYEFFIRDYKKRQESDEEISDAQHISDLKQLLRYMEQSEHEEEVEEILSKYLKLRCIEDGDIIFKNPYKVNIFFSKTEDDLSIELYYKNLPGIHPYFIDEDFYKENEINRDQLEKLEVIPEVTVIRGATTGTYTTGRPGGQPVWTTYMGFLWELTLDKLKDALAYIGLHPKAMDSYAKSSYIMAFLLKNEDHLCGTVYINGIEKNKEGEKSKIIKDLNSPFPSTASRASWNGKWLYTKANELKSHKEISKNDLNPNLYRTGKPDSKVYEWLGFKKNEQDRLEDAKREFSKFSEEKQEQYLQIALMKKYGMTLEELDEALTGKSGSSVATSSQLPMEDYEFPESDVKNWDALKKHATETLYYAVPTEYQYVLRRIRVSNVREDKKNYLHSMYQIGHTNMYACQMCHKPFPNVETCEISNKPELELDPVNLCLCPNCAALYRKLRNNTTATSVFLNRIRGLNDFEITAMDHVEIPFENKKIWFTQTHVAEIRELIVLQNKAERANRTSSVEGSDKGVTNAGNEGRPKVEPKATVQVKKPSAANNMKPSQITTDPYQAMIGKRIWHKTRHAHAVIKACDSQRMTVEFTDGAWKGWEKKLSMEACRKGGIIEIVE